MIRLQLYFLAISVGLAFVAGGIEPFGAGAGWWPEPGPDTRSGFVRGAIIHISGIFLGYALCLGSDKPKSKRPPTQDDSPRHPRKG